MILRIVKRFFSVSTQWFTIIQKKHTLSRIAIILVCCVIVWHSPLMHGEWNIAHAIVDEALDAVEGALKAFLYGIAALFGLIGVAAGVLFGWLVDPGITRNILNSIVIDSTWTIVRDLINLSFILVLLFSAFATIFQVDTYHLRKTLLRIVLAAIFINFSLAVSRLIIDIANIVMYYLLANLFPTLQSGTYMQIPAFFGESTNIADVLMPERAGSYGFSYIFAVIFFAVLFGISLMALAFLLLIRTCILAFLLVFSAIAFMGSVMPMFGNYSKTWWRMFMQYVTAGPILIFMLYFALQFMTVVRSAAYVGDSDPTKSLRQQAATGSPEASRSIITDLAFLWMPIIILWMGILGTTTMSDGASKFILKHAQSGTKKVWSGTKTFGRGIRKGTRNIAPERFGKMSGRAGAMWATSMFNPNSLARQKREKEYTAARDAELALRTAGPPGSSARQNVLTAQFSAKTRDEAKKLEDFDEAALKSTLDEKNMHKRMAAALKLAESGSLGYNELKRTMKDVDLEKNPEMRGTLEMIHTQMKKNNKSGSLTKYALENKKTENGKTVFVGLTGKKYDSESDVITDHLSGGIMQMNKQDIHVLADDDGNIQNAAVKSHINNSIRTTKHAQDLMGMVPDGSAKDKIYRNSSTVYSRMR